MNNENNATKVYEVPIWQKATISLEEAVEYTGIGRDKLRELTIQDDCPFVLWIGRKRLIIKKDF